MTPLSALSRHSLTKQETSPQIPQLLSHGASPRLSRGRSTPPPPPPGSTAPPREEARSDFGAATASAAYRGPAGARRPLLFPQS